MTISRTDAASARDDASLPTGENLISARSLSRDPLKIGNDESAVVDILLLPGFDIHDLSTLLDTFQLANTLIRRRVFIWRIVGLLQRQVQSSSCLVVSTSHCLDEISHSDNIFLLAGYDRPYLPIASFETWVMQQLWHGAHLGAIGSSSDFLAERGLLCNRSCAVHWAHIANYRRRHLHINFLNQVYQIDQGVVSCGGGCATTDLALACVRQLCGRALSIDIADRLNRYRVRDQHDIQGKGATNPIVRQATQLMQQHLEAPLRGHEIARRLGIPLRRLQRLFRQHERLTPSQFYIRERLLQARNLLRYTAQPVSIVAARCGFVSVSDFARNYVQLFGNSPSRDR